MSEKPPKQYLVGDDLKIYENPSLDLERYYAISCLKKKDIKIIKQFISKHGNNGVIQFSSLAKSGRKQIKFDSIKPLDQSFIQSAQWFSIKMEDKSNHASKQSVHPKIEKTEEHHSLPFKKKIKLDSPVESHIKPLVDEVCPNKENIQALSNKIKQNNKTEPQLAKEEETNQQKIEPQLEKVQLSEQTEEEKLKERIEQFSTFYCKTKDQINSLHNNVNGNWDYVIQVLNGNEYLEWKPFEDEILKQQRYHSYGYKLLIYYKTKQEVVKRIQRLQLDVPLDITFQFDLDVK